MHNLHFSVVTAPPASSSPQSSYPTRLPEPGADLNGHEPLRSYIGQINDVTEHIAVL